MIMLIANYSFLLAEVALLISIGLLIANGLSSYTQYLRVLFYLSRKHSEQLLASGVDAARVIYSQVLPLVGFSLWILALFLVPTLSPIVFFVVMLCPAPYYMSAMPSTWNYWNKFWWHRDEDLGDPYLARLRVQGRSMSHQFLEGIMIAFVCSVVLIFLGVILLSV